MSAQQAHEVLLASLNGETSDFVRFNHAAVRQAGSVQQQSLSVDLIDGLNHAEDIVYWTDGTYTIAEVLTMEARLLLGFDVGLAAEACPIRTFHADCGLAQPGDRRFPSLGNFRV